MEQITQQLQAIDWTAIKYPFEGMLYTALNFKDLAEPVAKALAIALGTSLATVIPLLLLTLGVQSKGVAAVLRGLDPSLPKISVFGIRLTKWIATMMCAFEAWLVVVAMLGNKLERTRHDLFLDVLNSRAPHVGRYVSDPTVVLPPATPATKHAQIKDLHELASIASTRPSKFGVFSHPGRTALGFGLQFIPVIGPMAYAYLEGEKTGVEAHHQLFQLKGMKPEDSAQWVLARRDQYTQFGFVAAALEAVPVLSSVTKFTNSVGAALWAADLEQRQAAVRGDH
ncbi:hypothetical protein HKX48_008775 [Thoreauomyces humboldtii]|nr:hypothetical protein HKX48_008775 [Thoreauomyces humboldtii]